MIFNLSVLVRVGLNGFPLIYSYHSNYMMVHIWSALKLTHFPRPVVNTTLSCAGPNYICQCAVQQTLHTEGIWIFCP